MKLIHLSDLHLGKRINEQSMLEDQSFILSCILKTIDAEKPDGVILAGDIYDKPVPSVEAMQLFEGFLYDLADRSLQVFVISGNHDSPERIAFGSRLITKSGIHLAPAYKGQIERITLHDEYGEADIYMLPFIKPANVRRYFEDKVIDTYTDAVRIALSGLPSDSERRNILITHQFVAGALHSDSEQIQIGGSDQVDLSVFSSFDYVALGHLHTPQNCGSPRIRYCGTPLKYSFSEARDEKSVTIVELKAKGELSVRTIPLSPLREMVELKGRYQELTLRDFYQNTSYREDYSHITLTDEQDIPDAIGKLRTIYKNLLRLDYDNARTKAGALYISGVQETEQITPLELFTQFYEFQNQQPLSSDQAAFMRDLIEKTWEEM